MRNQQVIEEELNDWCLNSELSPSKRPRRYVFIHEIPKSPVGKILRRLLVKGEYEPDR